MSNPMQKHIQSLKGLLRYLRQTKYYVIAYSPNRQHNALTGYADADYAIDGQDRKSTYEVVFFLAEGTIS